jgi:hypothetical protein
MRAPSNVADALRQLDRSAHRFLDAEAVQKLREEVAAHFESDVQARVEMGQSPAEAEQASVAAFGDIADLVWQVREAQTARGKALDPVFTGALLAGAIAYASSFLVRSDGAGALMLLGIVVSLALCIWATWRVRRLQWRAFALTAVPAWLCLTLAQCVTYRSVGGEQEALTPPSLQRGILESRHHNSVQRKYIANLEAAYHEYQRTGGLRIANTYDQETGAVIFGKAKTVEIARRTWDMAYRDLPKMRSGLEGGEQWVTAAEAALQRSWAGEIPYRAVGGASTTGGIFSVFAAAHLLTLLLRYLIDETHRTWRRLRGA